MSPVLEAQLEAYFRKRVRLSLGGVTEKLAPTRKGMPDRLVLLPGGRIYLVELKTDTGRLSPAQIHWHAIAARVGTTVVTLSGQSEIDAWIRARGDERVPRAKFAAPRPAPARLKDV